MVKPEDAAEPGRPQRGELPGLVVGIGASAGGLEALQALFASLPSDAGIAFVVVQHLDARRPSLLPELLRRHTRMPVDEAVGGDRLKADHVAVIAPGTVLAVRDGALHVAPAADGRGLPMPIDALFRSLAEDRGDRAAAVLLSGSGSDGTHGLRAIREHGGLALAQSPETAKHDGMVRSAIESGLVDRVLPVVELAGALVSHARALAELARSGSRSLDEELAAAVRTICALLQRRTGHDFSRYKEGTLLRRIRRRLQVQRAASVADYLRVLEEDPREPELLLKDLLVGVTELFRDPEAFEALSREAIGPLVRERAAEGRLRIWVPGCATGEEAYSIGILVREWMDRLDVRLQAQLFATDLDAEAVADARQGRYAADVAERLSPERLARFFVRDGAGYQAVKELREMCIFSQHSLIRDPPFSSLDLVSCRNVLIYLEPELQRKLVPLLHYALRPGGFLFLGPAEGITSHPELFDVADKRHRIFRRKEPVRAPAVEFPLSGRAASRPPQPAAPRPPQPPTARERAGAAFERTVLGEYAPATALVNGAGEILFVAGRPFRYLQPPAGPASMNLLDAAHGALRVELRGALGAAARSRRKVVRQVTAEVDDEPRRLRLTVRPMPGVDEGEDLYLVVLQEEREAPEEDAEPEPPGEEPPLRRMEEELHATRAELKRTVEDLEAANEELKSSNEELISTNEELQSANEELQTSKEELQSLNEELETVNAELRQKVDELGAANSDLQNHFASTDIATIFLDRALRVVKFTPAATALFRLLDGDVGRPLSDLAPPFAGGDLTADALQVLRTLVPIEREARAGDGARWFVVRLLPYRTVENAIAGVVVTLVDVSRLKQAEAEVRRHAQLLHLSHDAILVYALDGGIEFWNRGAEELYGYGRAEALGHVSRELLATVFPRAWEEIADELRHGGCWVGEFQQRTRDGRTVFVLGNFQLVRGEDGVDRVLESCRDITARRAAEEALRATGRELEAARFAAENERLRLQAIMDALPVGVAITDARGGRSHANAAYERIWGGPIPPADSVSDHARYLAWWLTGEPLAPEEWASARALATGEPVIGQMLEIQRFDGQRAFVLNSAAPVRDAAGRVVGSAVALQDITGMRRAEEERARLVSQLRASVAEAQRNQAQLESVIQAMQDGVVVFDMTGRVVLVNDAEARIIGYASADEVKQDLTRFAQVFEVARLDGTPLPLEEWPASRVLRGESVAEWDLRARRRDTGQEWFFSFGAEPVRDEHGVQILAVVVTRDITARKRAELALSESAARERTRGDELQALTVALREADRRKDEFLAVLSHELRNPLAPIRNGLAVLHRVPPTSDSAHRAREVMERQVAHLCRLVDDLLDTTRVSRNKISLQRRHLDLNALVRSTVEDQRSLFEKAEVRLVTALAPGEVPVHGDETRLAQVVGNLLQNAAKFTPAGGEARIEVRADEGAATLTVSDTGVGMSPETIGRLFEPFSQADTTLDRSRSGLGLGLALVKGLVVLHGGSVSAHSAGPGQGSRFVVRLPLDATPRAGAPGPAAAADPKRRRVLVIEDNVDAAESLRDVLELGGHEVALAHDGPDGLARARALRPDVVLCDIGLPGMDGFAVARAMRADGELKDTYLVALSGYALPEDVERASAAGFDRHVSKPPEMRQLEQLLAAGRPRRPATRGR